MISFASSELDRHHPNGMRVSGLHPRSGVRFFIAVPLFILFFLCICLLLIFLFIHSPTASGDYSVEFVSGDLDGGDPGEDVDLIIQVKNTGDQATRFTLHDPELPEEWSVSWPNGNGKTTSPEENVDHPIRISIPSDHDHARAGVYYFDVTGEYETDGDPEQMQGGVLVEVFVNIVRSVELSADDPSDEGEPGENITIVVQLSNTGNANDSFSFDFQNVSGPSDASPWFSVTDQPYPNDVFIEPGDTEFISLQVSIPEFLPGQSEAKAGLYEVSVWGISNNRPSEMDSVNISLRVEELYKPALSIVQPIRGGIVSPDGTTSIIFDPRITNEGNTNDDILISVPADELSGDKVGWSVTIDSQVEQTYGMDSLSYRDLDVRIFVDGDTEAGAYTIRLRAESQGDTSSIGSLFLYLNLTAADLDVELTQLFPSVDQVNPVDMSEISYIFRIENVGNLDDSYIVAITSNLSTAPYKDWSIELEDKVGGRSHSLEAPAELSGNTIESGILEIGERIDSKIYILPDLNASAGLHETIQLSVTSQTNTSRDWVLNFSIEINLPDLMVNRDPANFSIDPSSDIEIGDSVNVHVHIFNQGTVESGPFTVWFYVSESYSPLRNVGTNFAARIIENLPAGQNTEVVATIDSLDFGKNDIFVYVDKPITEGKNKTYLLGEPSLHGEVLEGNETNNYATLPATYHSEIDHSPDLSIESVDLSTTKPGTECVIEVIVRNSSPYTIPDGFASLQTKVNGTQLSDSKFQDFFVLLDGLAVNATKTVLFKWSIASIDGNHTLDVIITVPGDQTPENNRVTRTVFATHSPPGPDLSVHSIAMANEGWEWLAPNATRTFVVVIRNNGNTEASATLDILLKGDPDVLLAGKDITVGPNDQVTISYDWIPGVIGNFTVIAELRDITPLDAGSADDSKEFEFTVTSGGQRPHLDVDTFIPFPSPVIVFAILQILAILIRRTSSRKTERNS